MLKSDVCEVRFINQKKVREVKRKIGSQELLLKLSDFFSLLSDPTKLKIVLALSKAELCVCDLASILKLSVSAISHQLRLLRTMKIVKFRKEGKMVYYTLDDMHIVGLIDSLIRHIGE